MNDRLDELLTHLPLAEEAAPDLAARIFLAVVARRQSRQLWRGVGMAAAAGGLVGLALTAVSWPEAAAVTAQIYSLWDASVLTQTLIALAADPIGASSQLVNGALSWQGSLAEGVDVALLSGTVLLAAAAFGGLARMLHSAMPPAGSAQSVSGV